MQSQFLDPEFTLESGQLGKCSFIKLRHHATAREGVFAAVVLGTGIFGEFLGELGEVFALRRPFAEVVNLFALGLLLLVRKNYINL